MRKINYTYKGSGNPLVFQHGLTANVAQINKLLGEIKNTQLLCMDCPGHGQSALPKHYHPSFNQYADDLINIVSQLKIDKACFGGLSMGAGIALNIGLRFPKVVKGLILLRPAWLSKSRPQNLDVLLKASSFIGQSNYIESVNKLAAFKSMHAKIPAAAKSLMGIFGQHQQAALPLVIQSMVQDSPFSNLADIEAIDVPCLIIGNDDDPLHPFAMAEDLHEKIKNSSLVKVASRYIDPDLHTSQVNSCVIDFLDKLK